MMYSGMERRIKKVEDKLGVGEEPVFVRIEIRNGRRGITLPDTGEWFDYPEEVKNSPKCRNVIVRDENGDIVLWRSRVSIAKLLAEAHRKMVLDETERNRTVLGESSVGKSEIDNETT